LLPNIPFQETSETYFTSSEYLILYESAKHVRNTWFHVTVHGNYVSDGYADKIITQLK
jgi:hypothetical protein